MANAVYGKRVDPLRGFRFRVTDVGGRPLGGFSMVSGLKDDTEIVEYREGIDGNVIRKLPGLTNNDNIVLERGLSVDDALQTWREEVFNAKSDNTLKPDDQFRRDLLIDLLDRRGNLVKRWRIFEAWPASLEIDDFDSGSSDVLLERVELANEGHELVKQQVQVAGRATL